MTLFKSTLKVKGDCHSFTWLKTKWFSGLKNYKIGNAGLRFKHVKAREINGLHRITVMVIQAIRAIGKDNMTEEQIRRFAGVLTSEEKALILKEGRKSSDYVYGVIKKICREE